MIIVYADQPEILLPNNLKRFRFWDRLLEPLDGEPIWAA
jgi:hypothetical protein